MCSYPAQVLYWLKGLDAGENDDTEVVGLPVVWAFSELLCGTARNQPTLRTVASRHPFAVQQEQGHATYLVAAERTANVAVIVRAADAGQTVAAGTWTHPDGAMQKKSVNDKREQHHVVGTTTPVANVLTAPEPGKLEM